MLRDRIAYYTHLLSVHIKEHDNGRGWVEGNCPFAAWTHASGHDNSMSFAISVSEQKSHYTCLACGEKGSLPNLAYRLGKLRAADYTAIGKEIEQYELLNRPSRTIPEWDAVIKKEVYEIPYIDESKYADCYYHPYLRKRGIGVCTAHRLRLKYDFSEHRILFPVRDYRGALYGYTGRHVANVCKPDVIRVKDYYGLKKRFLFLGEHLATQARFKHHPLVIVEGLFDYAKLVEAGFPNTIAILGTEITPEKYEKLELFDRHIVWMLDNDQGGEKTLYGRYDPVSNKIDSRTSAIERMRGIVPQSVVQYNATHTDPGSCSIKDIQNLVRKAIIVA